MKFKFKAGAYKESSRGEGFIKKPFLFLLNFFRNLKKSYLLMSKTERFFAILFLLIAVSLSSFRFYKGYIANTKPAPTRGGEYSEAIVGDIKFLNPITAQNDAERSVTKLLFSGLVKIEDQNKIEPDLASSYKVSENGLVYTFNLRKNLFFSDGQPLTANDVAFTIDSIKAPELKSPLYKSWKDVEAEVVDDYIVRLTLPISYGPFIYNCDFGILPAHLSTDDFSKKLVGSGPFQFKKSYKEKDKIKEIDMVRNENYYGVKTYLDKVKLSFFQEEDLANKYYSSNDNVSAIFGTKVDIGQAMNFSSTRSLGLIFNLRDKNLADKTLRKNILTGKKIKGNLAFTLTTLDIPSQRQKAEELKGRFESQGLNLNIDYENGVNLQDKLMKKDYQMLLYGFDFGYDRDPYPYWHSSQKEEANFAGWSNKSADILMEDARMLEDSEKRNAKYDQIFKMIKDQYLAEFYDPITYDFYIRDNIKGVSQVKGNQPTSRFNDIKKWYIKEKRVRK